MENFPGRMLALRQTKGWTQERLAAELQISSNYVSLLEGGRRQPSSRLLQSFTMLERAASPAAGDKARTIGEPADAAGSGTVLAADPPVYGAKPFRQIPVIGWAHAGEAGSYEELPIDWQHRIPTECRDPNAFAVVLEGESMEPKYSAGDLLVLQPNREAYSGCLAVCKFRDDGVVFRRVEFLPDGVRLVALNTSYEPVAYPRDSFAWIYPLWGRWTQVWR